MDLWVNGRRLQQGGHTSGRRFRCRTSLVDGELLLTQPSLATGSAERVRIAFPEKQKRPEVAYRLQSTGSDIRAHGTREPTPERETQYRNRGRPTR